jgi:hypothetical protein
VRERSWRDEALAVCEKYRVSLEARDADAILALVSPRYRDDSGTTYATLTKSLKRMLGEYEMVTYAITYGDVRERADGTVTVEYRYDASYKTRGSVRQVTSDAELVLERAGATFRILKGM